jgi:hypothetical protein
MDIGKLFEGKYTDGSGCLIGPATVESSTSFVVPFTLGVRSVADTQDMLALKISYLTNKLDDVKQKIMTRIELLNEE